MPIIPPKMTLPNAVPVANFLFTFSCARLPFAVATILEGLFLPDTFTAKGNVTFLCSSPSTLTVAYPTFWFECNTIFRFALPVRVPHDVVMIMKNESAASINVRFFIIYIIESLFSFICLSILIARLSQG